MTNSKTQPLLGHLEELRVCIFICLGYLAIGTSAGFLFSSYILAFLKLPLKNIADNLIILKPTEAVVVYFKISIYAGLILSSPGILYQAWKFLKPGMPDYFSTSFINWLIPALLLFCLGTIFTYFVILPTGLKFLINLSMKIANPTFTLDSYISFMLSIMLLGGIVFEMPILCAVLSKTSILKASFMKKNRKEAFFGLLVIAAVITPTTDVFNMMLFALPMFALYEISIITVIFMEKLQHKNISEGAYLND